METVVTISVLVVEDEPACRTALKTMLEKHKAKVHTANSAEEAIDFLRKNSVDVLLSDIILPGISGIDMLKQIRGFSPDIPVIMITGHGSLETAVSALKLGAQDYLLKPVRDSSSLWRTVHNAAATYALLKKNAALTEEIRQNEKKFRALFNHADDAILLFELTPDAVPSPIAEANEAALNCLQTKRNELHSISFPEMVAPSHRSALTIEWLKLLKWPHSSFSTMIQSRSGRRIPAEVRCRAFSCRGKRLVIAIARDISASLANQRDFAGQMEKERRAIGREIHDNIAQDIASVNMLAKTIQRTLTIKPSAAIPDLEVLAGVSSGLLLKARDLSTLLFPALPEGDDFPSAINALLIRMKKLHQVNINAELDNAPQVMDNNMALNLLRIIEESIRNAVRHGHATCIEIALRKDRKMNLLSITDNGCGFSAKERHGGLGLNIMRHRAELIGATISVASTVDKGTTVECKWP
jgi:PAS domain S-box-containing protein